MKMLRTIHLLVGCLVSPMVLFLSVTGLLQAFGYHESLKDGSYKAPNSIRVTSSIHKNEFFRPPRPAVPCDQIEDPKKAEECRAERKAIERAASARKKFFAFVLLIVGSGASFNAATGTWLAFRQRQWKRSALILFAIGIAFPGLFLIL